MDGNFEEMPIETKGRNYPSPKPDPVPINGPALTTMSLLNSPVHTDKSTTEKNVHGEYEPNSANVGNKTNHYITHHTVNNITKPSKGTNWYLIGGILGIAFLLR